MGDGPGDLHLFGRRKPETAIAFGNREPEQAEPLHRVENRRRDAVAGIDLRFGRNQALVDEPGDGVEKASERIGIESHRVPECG